MKIQECWRHNYSSRKKRRNTERIKTSIIKMEHCKISKLLSNSGVSKFVTKRMIEVNNLSMFCQQKYKV